MERKAQRGQESWLWHTDGRWQSQDSLHKPLPVSYNQVSNVALDSILRETSQTRNAPCTGPAIPPYHTISRPAPFGRRARCTAQDSAMLTSQVFSSWKSIIKDQLSFHHRQTIVRPCWEFSHHRSFQQLWGKFSLSPDLFKVPQWPPLAGSASLKPGWWVEESLGENGCLFPSVSALCSGRPSEMVDHLPFVLLFLTSPFLINTISI